VITHKDLAELATAPAPFSKDGWIFELKYDGFRMLATHRGKHAELLSRRGNDFAHRFPEITAALLELPEIVLDGELAVLDAEGRPLFDQLRWRSRLKKKISIEHAPRARPAVLFAFDLLELDGEDIRTRTLLERKRWLQTILKGTGWIRCADHVATEGDRLFQLANSLGLEGIVAKRADSPYRRGRCGDWVKIKTSAGRSMDDERSSWNER
jgi:bifunctional non-homologous end joining protein LigD